jgi:cell division protein FtsI/penicillin-binding protein 2
VSRTRQERIRLGVIFVAVCLFFAVAVARLSQLQIFRASQYSAIVEAQSSGKVAIPADRGVVFDRRGEIVANNVIVSSLYAYPASEAELPKICRYVEQLFALKPGTARKKFGLAPRKFRWIKRMLPDDVTDYVEITAPRGLYLREEKQRVYPFGLVGRQVLGYTDIDNNGQAGFELSFDSLMAGRQGWADIFRDGLRNTFRVKEMALVKPVPGKSYVLTVDWRLQEIVEEELRTAVDTNHAKSGMALFLDCRNGDVLAAAHFDPREAHPDKPVKLRPVSDQFEPGSVYKVFTAAGLLDNDLVDFNRLTNCGDGEWAVGRRVLHDDKRHGLLTFREIMEVSSNIGVGKWALDLGGEQLYETCRRFNIGRKFGVGLPGEAGGYLARPQRWSDYNVAALAMGHSVAVTALQLAAGLAAIANGGELVRPRVVLGEVDEQGVVTNLREREVLGRVMDAVAADTLRAFLRGVVERGTAQVINSEVIALAGKTGTAQIPDLVNKRYFQNKYMASFAGFFPYERPMVAGIVVLEEPEPIHYGGYTAGPAFRNVAERYTILRPELLTDPDRTLVEKPEDRPDLVEVPDITGRTVATARDMAKRKDLVLRCNSEEGQVVWQYPRAKRLLLAGDELVAVAVASEKEPAKMMDVTGLSIREVSALLRYSGVNFTVQGCGRVVKQSIPPGEPLSADSMCQLECQPI